MRAFSAPKLFGSVLRELRIKGGYSQDSFAHKSGYHRNYIGQLERGEKSPSLTALFVLADSLHVAPTELIRRVEILRKRAS